MTVLIRYNKTRMETVMQALTVEYYPKSEPEPGLLIQKSENEFTKLSPTPEEDDDFRDVFVMNDHGATVARYIL